MELGDGWNPVVADMVVSRFNALATGETIL